MGTGVAWACGLTWLAALSIYDIRERRLPNALTLPGAVVILGVAAVTGRGVAAMLGALALVTLYLLVHLVAPGGLGAGDVKLAIGIGALTGAFGADPWTLAALGAPVLTAVWALACREARATVPHGPSMCVAAAAAVAFAVW